MLVQCDNCFTEIDDKKAVFALRMPDLLSMEQFAEGFKRATESLEATPPTEAERAAYVIAATLWLSRLPERPEFDQDQMATAGRALMDMGGSLVTLCKPCAKAMSEQ